MEKLLIVEDDHLDRKTLKRIVNKTFRRSGCSIYEAESLAEAKRTLDDHQDFTFILLDHYLADGTASQFLHYLRERKILIPSLVITGQDEVGLAANVLKLGANEYIHKDCLDVDTLHDALTTARRTIAIDTHKAQHLLDLETFASRVSHDVRNTLTAVLGHLDLYKSHQDANRLDQAEKMVTKAIQYTESLLQFSLTQNLHKTKFSLNPMIDDIVACLTNEGHQIEVECEVLPEIYGDRALVGTIFDNLIGNCIKFARPGTPVKINIYPEDKYIVIGDNGRGFTDEEASKIFQPLTRVSKVETDGFGLGLATVKRIVEEHDGEIFARGVPDKGANFYIYFPQQMAKTTS